MSNAADYPTDIRPLAKAIAEHLDGFEVKALPNGWDKDAEKTRARLVHKDGRVIGLILGTTRYGRAPEGKLHVYGEYGTDNGQPVQPQEVGAIRYNESAPAINISAKKSPNRIAREIERRFLGEYTPIWQYCQEKICQYAEQREVVARRAEEIRLALGLEPPSVRLNYDKSQATIYLPYREDRRGSIEVGPTWVSFDLSTGPDAGLSLAKAIAGLTRE
ncbi:MAG TPA: hypothetical protein VF212_17595 [Longimicrobiales bacterium]